MPVKRLLITGAAGRLGSILRDRLRERFAHLRLSDIADLGQAAEGEELVQCDLANAEAVHRLCRDVDAIIHLGGCPREAPWPTIQLSNLIGCINVWEGARLAGADRILFASSNHVVGLYPTTVRLDEASPPMPDTRYGLSKAFGEDVAALYAFKYGVRGFCMRIGSCFPEPRGRRMLSTWLSYDDFVRLVETGLSADYVHEIVYGVSANTRIRWDNRNAIRLGYRPADDAERFASKVEDRVAGNPLAEERHGGGMVPDEFVADPAWSMDGFAGAPRGPASPAS